MKSLKNKTDSLYSRLVPFFENKSYFSIYTVCFIITCLFVFSWYFFTGRTFIWQQDAWHQHFRDLVYYAKYLRSIIKTFLSEHKLVMPRWDYTIGQGGDILGTLNYYVIGDPFTVFCVLVPTRYMHIYYGAISLLRIYCAGLAFSALCFYMNKDIIRKGRTAMSRYGILAGAISYCFCYWAVKNAARHPYFINPMIFLPLLILGIEKILNRERPYVFIISVLFSAVSNFYFFYMLVLLTVIYTVIRLGYLYRTDLIRIASDLVRIGIFSVMGVIIAAVILFPSLYTFLSDSRMGSGASFDLLYHLRFYSKLPGVFLYGEGPEWTALGLAAPILLAVFLLFIRKKENTLLKGYFCVTLVFVCFPAFGKIFNGFSYNSNRWIWGFVLVCCFILAVMWKPLMELTPPESAKLLAAGVGYYALCYMLEESRKAAVFAALCLVFIMLLCLASAGESQIISSKKARQQIVLLIVAVSVIGNSFWLNASPGSDYASSMKEADKVYDELGQNETRAIRTLEKEEEIDPKNEAYRFCSHVAFEKYNVNMYSHMSSLQYSWTLSNPYTCLYLRELGNREYRENSYGGFDNRSDMMALASVLYYVAPSGDTLQPPYGFTELDRVNVRASDKKKAREELKAELGVDELTEAQQRKINSATETVYRVYKNENPLPYDYSYDSYITKNELDSLSLVEKQEAMMNSVVLDDEPENVKKADSILTKTKEIPYTLKSDGDNVVIQDHAFVVTAADSTVTLSLETLPNSENYFSVTNLHFKGTPTYDLYFGDESVDPNNLYNRTNWKLLNHSKQQKFKRGKLFWEEPDSGNIEVTGSNGSSKNFYYGTDNFTYYNGRTDFAVNLDYSEEKLTSIKLTFKNQGIYTYDSIKVESEPLDDFSDKINLLKSDVMDDLVLDTDNIHGSITLDRAKILCFSVPYSKGWTAYVDGKETRIYNANLMYMGIEVGEGTHTIQLVYHTPFLKWGMLVSLIGVVIFAIYILLFEYRRKRKA